jgi:predicted transcriptional regulator
LNAENVTRIVIARYDQSLQGASVTAGPAGNAYIAWEEGQPGPSASVYVAQVSRDGQLAFVRQLSSPNPLGSRIDYVVSADSQDNLYLIWYQPNVPNIPNVDTSASRVLTSVAYLKLDRDGAVSQSGNELVEGPVLAVTVSTTGDVYAISRQGIVNVTQPTAYWSISPILASVAAASAVGGASMVEELRYKAAHSAVRALGVRKRSKTTSDAILKTLCRKPGLTIGELKHLVPTEKPSMLKLAMLENEGYISSVRIGLRRRFYGSEQLMSPENPSSGEYDSIPLRILHEIEQNPGTWEARLSQTLGLSQQIVHYHLKKLQTSRIISAETVGKRKQYRLGSTSRQEPTAQSDMPT